MSENPFLQTCQVLCRILIPGRGASKCFTVFSFCLLIFCTLWFVGLPERAWGRAGGGENFGGGGGGGGGGFGGGGFSGGGGGFDGIGFPRNGEYTGNGEGLNLSPPVIFIIVVVIIILLAIGSQQAQQQHMTQTIRRGRQRQNEREQNEALQQLQQRDPGFSAQAFLQRVQMAFEKIQAAWSQQDLTAVRPFISDGIYERFSLQTGMQQAAGFRNVMEQIQILNTNILALYSTTQFDTIHIRIQASATDYDADLKSGRKISGTEHSGPFVEIWSFCRRLGVQTLNAKEGGIEGNCPRCGALLKITDQAQCQSCGAQVNSGEYDWVLSEITQESEWQLPGPEQQLPGMKELTERDPGFNLQHLEDRVSVMFWRMRAAEFYREEKYAAPVLTPEFREKFIKSMQSNSRYWKEPAVGQVELLNAGTAAGMDQLQIMVRWSGTLIDKVGGRETVLREQTIYTQLYTLIRDANVLTNPVNTFTSAGCPSCGAPINVDESGGCSYCGATLTNGKFDWVLQSVERFSPEMAQTHLVNTATLRQATPNVMPKVRTELPLSILASVMLADGQLDDRELAALQKLAARGNLSSTQLEQILQQARVKEISIPVPETPLQAKSYLVQLVQAVLTDGQITREESRLMNTFAQRMHLSDAEVQLTIRQERARAYQAAKVELGH